MNKWVKQGLLYVSLLSVFSFMVGCSLFGGGLDDAQKVVATFINALYSKSDTPSAEERYQKLASVHNQLADPNVKAEVIQDIEKFMQNGIDKDYYIADHPTEPQTDKRRTIVVQFPKNIFANPKSLGGDVPSYDAKGAYFSITLNKEGKNWKVVDLKETDGTKLQKADWKKVSPTDYLN